jgi:putative sterol carrier protein
MSDQFDPSVISPEQFAEMVAAATDDQQIAEAIHAVGTEPTLDRIFEGFEERFRPDKAEGVDAEIQFTITDDGTDHAYVVAVRDGTCTANRGTASSPKTALSTDLVSFVKLVTGQADGVQLFMTRKLKVSGDLMFSQRIMTFFEAPRATSP